MLKNRKNKSVINKCQSYQRSLKTTSPEDDNLQN